MKQRSNSREAKKGASKSTSKIAEVRFYRSNEKPYGVLSNLYRRPIVFEGQEYPTAEHAYQAGKARRPIVRDWLMSAPSPALLAMAAHGLYSWDIAPQWSKVKFDRMRKVLEAKFTQHTDLADVLLSTGNARLVEVGTVDNLVNRTWGEVNGKGKNMLGILLMELRDKLEVGNLSNIKNSKSQPKPRVRNTGKQH
ncbi:NADAR family protein [Reyranella aquatilis]|uniref:NADAR family protein n=1 Tax=Reyranella aquatilis TaxID=2035356 RepID=A0ABS8L2K9_9HYPH|nr:NADAR family protein [Reyranella aquatilis]MCC8432560.1 NADAR family protein [Reyranella aquatilis]